MTLARTRGVHPYDAHLFAMVDRLVSEYEDVGIRTIYRAVSGARSALREQGQQLPDLATLEALARQRLGS
jgi:hypothetical protein